MTKTDTEFMRELADRYGIAYSKNKHTFISNLALKGQFLINSDEVKKAEEIGAIIKSFADKWADQFILLKYYLYYGQLEVKKNGDPLPSFKKALKIAQKQNIADIEVGVRIQIAFEYFRTKKHKKALKQIHAIEKYTKDLDHSFSMLHEIKSRIYWDLDDYKAGVDATYNWFRSLKDDLKDIKSLFITIVYLITIITSFPDKFSENKIKIIQNDINDTLELLSKSVYLYDKILRNLDTLFTQSIMIVKSSILHDFADSILKNIRWTQPNKFLYFCRTFYEKFFKLNQHKKALEMIDHALSFAKDLHYDKIEELLRIKKLEVENRIFFLESKEAESDFDELILNIKETQPKTYLNKIVLTNNLYPGISYSDLLWLIEKAEEYTIMSEKNDYFVDLPEESTEGMFILHIELSEFEIDLLMKEEFQEICDEKGIFQSFVLPYYRMLGVLSSENDRIIDDIQLLEKLLLDIQRGINCPGSKISIKLINSNLQLQIFKFYSKDKDFKNLKQNLLTTALQLKRKYPFLKSPKFLQIFRSDPITIFDLCNRKTEQFTNLSKMLADAYDLKIEPSVFFSFFTDLKELLLHNFETRYWKEFFFQYTWLHNKMELRHQIKIKGETSSYLAKESLVECLKRIPSLEKKVTCYYLRIIALAEENKDPIPLLNKFEEYLDTVEKKKYKDLFMILSKILSQNPDEDSFSTRAIFFDILNFSKYDDWEKTEDLLRFFINNKKFDLTELNYSQQLSLNQIFVYLKCISLSEVEINRDVFNLLKNLKISLLKIKNKSSYKSNRWKKAFVLINTQLFNYLENNDQPDAEIKFDDVLNELINYWDWIDDTSFLIEMIIKKTEEHLKKSEHTHAHKYYKWLEQYLLWNWDLIKEDKELEKRVEHLNVRIQNQYYS